MIFINVINQSINLYLYNANSQQNYSHYTNLANLTILLYWFIYGDPTFPPWAVGNSGEKKLADTSEQNRTQWCGLGLGSASIGWFEQETGSESEREGEGGYSSYSSNDCINNWDMSVNNIIIDKQEIDKEFAICKNCPVKVNRQHLENAKPLAMPPPWSPHWKSGLMLML